MIVMMIVSLFTFRELMKLLGVTDYGAYNAVGGVVILFSFLSSAINNANQRFLSYHIGNGDRIMLNKTFSMIINVQIIISVVVLIVAETVGLWLINTKMNFDGIDMSIINWVYQFTILTFIIQLIQIPYTSAIIAHERMSVFSYASIADALLRLSAVLLLRLAPCNRLPIYSALLLVIAIIMLSVYALYCKRYFNECKYGREWNPKLFRQLIEFSGWNMVGGMGNVGATQGINILFNHFNGVVVNAAMGVSNQVNVAVTSLVGNMQTAFNPQIIKAYATEEYSYFHSLIFRSARLSFFLISIVGIPIIICASPILHIWLTEVPEYSVSFTQLVIAYCIVDSLSGPLWIANQACGRIKVYMIVVATLTLTNIPLAYLLLNFGLSPVLVMFGRVIIVAVILNFRILYLGRTIAFPCKKYYFEVILRAILYVLSAYAMAHILNCEFSNLSEIRHIFIVGGSTFILTTITGFYIMLSATERNYILTRIKPYLHKLIR